MNDFPGKDWEAMLRRQREVERQNYLNSLSKKEDIQVIARWICKSGYWRHIEDKERQWERCQIEADGLLDDLKREGFTLNKNLK